MGEEGVESRAGGRDMAAAGRVYTARPGVAELMGEKCSGTAFGMRQADQ